MDNSYEESAANGKRMFKRAAKHPVYVPRYTTYRGRAKVWLYPGTQAQWHFITIPKRQSDEMKKKFGSLRRGWGSVPVRVAVGKTVWKTSVFPDRKSGAYLLPLKRSVRTAEGIEAGHTISFRLEIEEL